MGNKLRVKKIGQTFNSKRGSAIIRGECRSLLERMIDLYLVQLELNKSLPILSY